MNRGSARIQRDGHFASHLWVGTLAFPLSSSMMGKVPELLGCELRPDEESVIGGRGCEEIEDDFGT